MKALTFKKSALVAALLTAASANAADTVKFGTATVADGTVAAGYVVAPLENANKQSVAVTTTADTDLIAFELDRALSAGDKITFTFANGGIDLDQNVKLMYGYLADDPDTASVKDSLIVDLPSSRFDSEDDEGVYTELTFRINSLSSATGLDDNSIIYLVDEDAAEATSVTSDTSAATPFAIGGDHGLDIEFIKGISSGAAVTASVVVDYEEDGLADYSAGSTAMARAYEAIDFSVATGNTVNVNYSNDGVTFVTSPSHVSSDGKTVTTSAITIAEATDLPKGVDWNNTGTVTGADITFGAATTPLTNTQANALIDLTKAEVNVTVKLDDCSAIDTDEEDSVILTSVTDATVELEFDEDETCTWVGKIDSLTDDGSTTLNTYSTAVQIEVTGEDDLDANSVTVTYDVKFDAATLDDGQAVVQTWETDVIASGNEYFFPSLVAANSQTTFSVVRFDNTGISKDADIVISGSAQNIVTGEVTEFENVFLATLEAGKLTTVLGDHVIDALVDTSNAPADFGYTVEDFDIDADANYYISVTMQAAGSADGSLGPVEAYQAGSTGRTAITVGGQSGN